MPSVTPGEFLAPFQRAPASVQATAALYYHWRYNGRDRASVDELRRILVRAGARRAAKTNLSQALGRARPGVERVFDGRVGGWTITDTGRREIESGLPADVDSPSARNVAVLERIGDQAFDTELRGYLDETIRCLRCGANRAAVVFLWSAAMHKLETDLLALPQSNLAESVTQHHPKARAVNSLSDFGYLKESIILMAAETAGILHRGERLMLEQALDLRNRCGHPSRYVPGEKRVAAFIEDVVTIVFRGDAKP